MKQKYKPFVPSEVEAPALLACPSTRPFGPKFILSGWLASQPKGSGRTEM